MKMDRRSIVKAAAATMLLAASSSALYGQPAGSAPLRITFQKSLATATPMVWKGTVNGAIPGQLETRLISLRETGMIWHVEFDWIITASNPADSFTARLAGTLNLKTGRVVMNGTVIEGAREGAQVHEEGTLIDPVTSTFQGVIRVMPASAD
jgi:hypothetical protein